MHLNVPDSLRPHEAKIRFVFELMIMKLDINRHKGFIDDCSPYSLFDGLKGETKELLKALGDGAQFDVALECADVANMAVLLAISCLSYSKEDYNAAISRPEFSRTEDN